MRTLEFTSNSVKCYNDDRWVATYTPTNVSDKQERLATAISIMLTSDCPEDVRLTGKLNEWDMDFVGQGLKGNVKRLEIVFPKEDAYAA